MASVQWKQLARNISGSGIFTGSLSVSGSIQTSGSLSVDGSTTLQAVDSGSYSLSVKGQMEVIQAQIDSAIHKAKIQIENLGALGDNEEDNTIDLGGFF